MAAICVALFVLNAWICRELFNREYTTHMESIEGSYMSISRWAFDHWPHLDWFPLWFCGMPFIQIYPPGFPLTVAALARVTGWSIQHAYHFLTALGYCFTPISLALLLYRASRRMSIALAGGVICSVLSPSSFLVPAIRGDTDHLLTGRRLIILLRYGEGPHSTAVAMLPLVLLVLHMAVTERKRWAVALAPVALSALVITNWPGAMGFAMALTAYVFSRFGATPRLHWLTMIATAVVGYLLICPWIPPSIVKLVQLNAQLSDQTILGWQKAAGLLAILIGLAILHLLFHRLRMNPWLKFFIYFSVITCAISLGYHWFGWRIIPQGSRFQVEFEVAASGLAAWLGVLALDRIPKLARIAVVIALVAALFMEAKTLRRYSRREDQPLDITRTIEYRMTQWFESNMHGARVFAPGNVSLWMSMFSDEPEMQGCCDPSIPIQTHRLAGYTIYSGQNAGAADAQISLTWLKAYGVDAIGVVGPKSTEPFRPFQHPEKFDHVVPLLWRSGDNAIYDVQRYSKSLAHVVSPANLVLKVPENGLDIKQLAKFVDELESPSTPNAQFQWISDTHARIETDLPPGRVLSVQMTYNPGWRVTSNGVAQPISGDALGLMVIHPVTSGKTSISLDWVGTNEGRWAIAAQIAGLGLVLYLTGKAVRFRLLANAGIRRNAF